MVSGYAVGVVVGALLGAAGPHPFLSIVAATAVAVVMLMVDLRE